MIKIQRIQVEYGIRIRNKRKNKKTNRRNGNEYE